MSKRPRYPSVDHDRRVWYKRDVLVTNPRNKFQNQKFGIALVDERGAGESYETVYTRLETAACDILSKRVYAYLNGYVERDWRGDKITMNEVRDQYFF